MDQPTPSGPWFNFQGIRGGHEYRYLPDLGEDHQERRGEACTARRVQQRRQEDAPLIVVEFADGEQLAVEWRVLKGLKERQRTLIKRAEDD